MKPQGRRPKWRDAKKPSAETMRALREFDGGPQHFNYQVFDAHLLRLYRVGLAEYKAPRGCTKPRWAITPAGRFVRDTGRYPTEAELAALTGKHEEGG